MSDFVVFILKIRIYNKLLIFAHGIKTNARSPLELRSLINSPVSPELGTKENIDYVLGSYELLQVNLNLNEILKTFLTNFPKEH